MKVIDKGRGGFKIRFNYQVDLSATTIRTLALKDPDGIVTTHDMTVADTTWVEYLVEDWDFDKKGTWTYHAFVVAPTWRLSSIIYTIIVTEIYEEVT